MAEDEDLEVLGAALGAVGRYVEAPESRPSSGRATRAW